MTRCSTRSTLTLPARDGYPLAATLYEPAAGAGGPRPIVLISSAVAVPQVFYQRFAVFLAAQGMVALTFDYRGIGRSRPGSAKGFRAAMHEWGTLDVAGALDWLADRYPQGTRFVIGHSIGASLFGLADNNQQVAGLVTVCGQSGDWRLWRGLQKLRRAATWYLLVPLLTRALGYLPGRKLGLGEDLPAGIALEWARWCRSRGFLAPHFGKSLVSHFGAFRGSLLAYSCADDNLAPRAAVDALLGMYTGAGMIQRRHVEPESLGLASLGHVGFFRKECAGLWLEVARWLHSTTALANHPSLQTSIL